MSVHTLLAQLDESEQQYARQVIEADLTRKQQLKVIHDFMAALAAVPHGDVVAVDHHDLTLTLSRDETRLIMQVSASARLLTSNVALYVLTLHEQWEKTLKRPAVTGSQLVTNTADAITARMGRMYLRFRNDIQTFEHDLALAQPIVEEQET